MTTRRLLLPALTVLAILAMASCSGSGSGDGAESDDCANPVPADTVRLEDFAFDPDCLVADAGGSIQLENVGDAPHTFTVEEASIDLDLAAGESAEASLSDVQPGSYPVTCTYHPQMKATLTVEGQ